MPEDVIVDLKRIAPLLGYSGYRPSMRADMTCLEDAPINRLLEILKTQGVSDTLAKVLADSDTLAKVLADLSAYRATTR